MPAANTLIGKRQEKIPQANFLQNTGREEMHADNPLQAWHAEGLVMSCKLDLPLSMRGVVGRQSPSAETGIAVSEAAWEFERYTPCGKLGP